MVEDVEGLGAELKVFALRNREVFQQSHVEIRSPGIAQNISAGIAKSQPRGKHERSRIVKKRTKPAQRARQWAARNSRFGFPIKVWIRASSSKAVPYAGIVGGGEKALVIDAERRTALNQRDAGPLPAAQQRVRQPFFFEKRQIVYITDRDVLALIEVGAGPVGIEVVRIDESRIVVVGRVVDRMAISIGGV